jgi:outer membrane protein insertion porin family
VNVLLFVPTRPGGDTHAVLNLEYRIPLVKTYVFATLFNDLGLNGDVRGLTLDPAAVTALQQQYPNPDFPGLTIPSRLSIASGTNFHPHTSAGMEIDIQLPIIQAPFRIYYAYNYLRLTQTIRPPLGAFNIDPALRQSLIDSGVYYSQVVPALTTFLQEAQSSLTIPPGLLEPKSTLRFTVGRTF